MNQKTWIRICPQGTPNVTITNYDCHRINIILNRLLAKRQVSTEIWYGQLTMNHKWNLPNCEGFKEVKNNNR